jgi:hypothetical protein
MPGPTVATPYWPRSGGGHRRTDRAQPRGLTRITRRMERDVRAPGTGTERVVARSPRCVPHGDGHRSSHRQGDHGRSRLAAGADRGPEGGAPTRSGRLGGRSHGGVFGSWDFDPSAVLCSLTWWHGEHDANAPIAAVQRLVATMGDVDLRLWNEAGHLEAYRRHDEILAEPLTR